MSLTITNQKSERQQVVLLRRQSVFMFIATHLDDDGCFSESDQFIANTVAASNRVAVNRVRKSLEATGDVMVVESGRHDAKGNQLPNKVRPVSVRTFWVREWVRNGSKTESSEHGQNASERSRTKSLSLQDLTQKSSAPVNTDETRVHEHKNNIQNIELPYSLSVGLQSTAYRAGWSEHGLDLPIRKALSKLRKELAAAQRSLAQYPPQAKTEMPERYRADIRRIEQSIAELEGHHE